MRVIGDSTVVCLDCEEKGSEPENCRIASFSKRCFLAYLFPGLHPDGFEDDESGWPRTLKAFAEEAWRRASAGRLSDDELYCSAHWAGLYDRMFNHQPDETERRLELAKVSATYAGG
jgi:hypothetical protein